MSRNPKQGGWPPTANDALLFMLNCYDMWSGPRGDSERCPFAADPEDTP